jgi:hypothetical protein
MLGIHIFIRNIDCSSEAKVGLPTVCQVGFIATPTDTTILFGKLHKVYE